MIVPDWLTKWIRGNDTGTSSDTIAFTLIGASGLCRRLDAPYDTSDVGRCVRLLELAAENGEDWRSRLSEVADVSPQWKPLVLKWEDIEAAFHEDVKLQNEARTKHQTAAEEAYKLFRERLASYWAELDEDEVDSAYDEDAPIEPDTLELKLPPSRCWWLVATSRLNNAYDPYEKMVPHPFQPDPSTPEEGSTK